MTMTSAEDDYLMAVRRYRDAERAHGAGSERTIQLLLDVARSVARFESADRAYEMLVASIPTAQRHLGTGHPVTWRIQLASASYCADPAERHALLEGMLRVAEIRPSDRESVREVLRMLAAVRTELGDTHGGNQILSALGERPRPPLRLQDLHHVQEKAKALETRQQWAAAESTWVELVDGALGVSEGFVIQARVGLHRVRHLGAPGQAHPFYPGQSGPSEFVMARLEEEEHEALSVMEEFDAWWRFEDKRLWGSMDTLWWRDVAPEGVGHYMVSQSPITAVRRVDVIRTIVLGAGADPVSRQLVRAIANAYSDHPDFRPSWLHHTDQTWISAARAHLR